MNKKFLKKIATSFFLAFFLLSCAGNEPSVNKAFLVTLKSEKLRFSDTAFIDFNTKKAHIEGYFLGKLVLDLKFANVVCLKSICMDKEEFNARYLHYSYYDDLLLDIINKKKLQFTPKIHREVGGFTQRYKDDTKDILYVVKPREVFFRDRKNSIFIKIKEI